MHDVLHYFQLQCEAQGLLADEHVAVAGGGVGGHDYAVSVALTNSTSQ